MMRFSSYHPIVLAMYFLSVFLIVMFTINPFLLGIALIGSLCFLIISDKKMRSIKSICFYLIFFCVVSLSNPLFSHNGVTTLFFINGNPFTLEALLYGFDIGVMLIAVLLWFRCFNLVITEEKLLYLFGKISPKIALLLSMALRFIPMLKLQAEKIRQAQTSMGLFSGEAWADKLKAVVRMYSALITWALENAVDTGSSMKARGYGLKNRSRYSLYRFRLMDGIALIFILGLDIVIYPALAMGHLDFEFYPKIVLCEMDAYSMIVLTSFAILSLLPFIIELKEGLQWKYYISKI